MRIRLIINPLSGKPRRRDQALAAVAELKALGAELEVKTPETPSETRSQAEQTSRQQADILLVAGGDGTLNAVVNGLHQLPKSERPRLGVLPSGRGNDFASDLGIHTVADALRALKEGSSRAVDLGRTDAGVFLGIAGTGFDAKVARRAQTVPLLSGSLLYSYSVFRTLIDFRPQEVRVEYDDGVYEGPMTFAAVGNTRRYGGGMRITPRADPSDGLLDLCLVKDVSRRTLVRLFPTVFSGRHLSHPKVSYLKSRSVTIETSEPGEVFADGEFLQKTPVTVEVLPKALQVVAPLEPAEVLK